MSECDICGKYFGSNHAVKSHKGKMHFDSVEERFWSKIEKGDKDECWTWAGTVKNTGYGHIKIKGKMVKATRYMMGEIKNKEIEDKYVLHKCHNSLCVNPNHLYIGDHSDNMSDLYRDRPELAPFGVGENSINARLNNEQVREIRKRYKNEDTTYEELSKDYPVSGATIGRIIRNETYKEAKTNERD